MSDTPLSYLPTPKFTVGQKVWAVDTDETREPIPCPDCHDTGEWTATSPAGLTVKVLCPRCKNATYGLPRNLPPLLRRVATFKVKELTVGSIQINTAESHGTPVRYMCEETGVGSGRVYDEAGRHGLFATEVEAAQLCNELRQAEQLKLDAEPHELTAADVGQWPLKVACEREWRHDLYNAFDQARYLREHIEELVNVNDSCDCDEPKDLEDCQERLRELLRELERYTFIDRHPLEAVLEAAHKLVEDIDKGGLYAPSKELKAALDKAKYTPYKALREEAIP